MNLQKKVKSAFETNVNLNLNIQISKIKNVQ